MEGFEGFGQVAVTDCEDEMGGCGDEAGENGGEAQAVEFQEADFVQIDGADVLA